MAKQISHYVCQNCGAEFSKWQGKCGQCGQWNRLVETIVSNKSKSSSSLKVHPGEVIKPLKLSEVKSRSFTRINTGILELDRVLGGGIVPGSIVLVAGEPGIGKSTLLTQLALKLCLNTKYSSPNTVLYVCGEESPEQIKLRIDRFQPLKTKENSFQFLPETNIENILTTLYQSTESYSLIVIDSVQTLWSQALTGSAGSIGQVRFCSQMLQTLAKKTNIPIFLIGHITKEGMIAGPKVLEHLVDTVLYLEGDPEHDFRILRASKNRFGPTDEVGIFKMNDKGMEEVKNPSKVFLEPRTKNQKQKIGAAVTVTMRGIRPMLVEIQALVVSSQLPMPRRVASGIDYKRLQVLCAVLQKRLGLPLATADVFINVAGGLKLTEPAADLAIALAIISSIKNKPLSSHSVSIGEIGLLGEIRQVSFMSKRLKEAKKLGYKTVIGEKERDLRQTLRYLR
jgi:DNA repair protein RadA/Sms